MEVDGITEPTCVVEFTDVDLQRFDAFRFRTVQWVYHVLQIRTEFIFQQTSLLITTIQHRTHRLKENLS